MIHLSLEPYLPLAHPQMSIVTIERKYPGSMMALSSLIPKRGLPAAFLSDLTNKIVYLWMTIQRSVSP